MIKLIDKQKIYLMHRDGVSNRQIATRLGIDKNTVNKYVAAFDKEMQGRKRKSSFRRTYTRSVLWR
ncbi:helix-turn-helix domain-containing protein [Candidatus Weimeria sp. HCP3S3_B5]|uniref:helix-turn-helix domain-containing protein n=1 Tax=Candidatus Weimeria sp. HCP3S3_B5 TaxID=3438871 RepID=UPI003F895F4D